MVRRIAIASLPFVAAGVVVAIVLAYHRDHSSQQATSVPTITRTTPTVAVRPHRRQPVALPQAPLQVHGATARHMAVPILEYHVISTPKPGTPYPQLWVDPNVFAAEMTALRHAGYWAITTKQAWQGWTQGKALPAKPVIVSFDDGYLSHYTHARPVLRHLGWPGVLNLELNNLKSGDLSARKVRGLIRSGWEINSHTLTHPDLTTVSADQLRTELVDSKQQIRRRFGVPASFFCYPAGRYDARVEAAVKAAGYLAATTEVEAYATARSDPYALPRIRVNGSDTPASLLARLSAERPAA